MILPLKLSCRMLFFLSFFLFFNFLIVNILHMVSSDRVGLWNFIFQCK